MLDPIKNHDLYGHNKISEFFFDAILLGRLPHALLFWGPESIGKATVAYQLVKFLFLYDAYGKEILKHKNIIPCRHASIFQEHNDRSDKTTHFSIQKILKSFAHDKILKRIEHYSHTDFMVLRDEFSSSLEPKKNRCILIDEIRIAIQFLQTTPALSSYRVAIIDSADYMNSYAANALLKTLEEPGKNTILIVIVSHIQNIPSTLLSRCRVIKFTQVSYSDFCKICGEQSKNLPIEVYNLIGGNMKLLQSILVENRSSKLAMISRISKIHNFQDIYDIIEWIRDDLSIITVLKVAILRLVVHRIKTEITKKAYKKKEIEENLVLFDKLHRLLCNTSDCLYLNQESILTSALFLLKEVKW